MKIVTISTYDACAKLIARYEAEIAAGVSAKRAAELRKSIDFYRKEMQRPGVLREHRRYNP